MAHAKGLGTFDNLSLAAMATAALRLENQSVVSCTGSADVTYTVTGADTRRVMLVYLGAGAGDIRFNFGAAATSASLPILPQRYVVIEAVVGEVLHFYNTVATANLNVAELL